MIRALPIWFFVVLLLILTVPIVPSAPAHASGARREVAERVSRCGHRAELGCWTACGTEEVRRG
ncbi:hypothetical protein Lfu02_75340 [Longispora fulva]|uniref:Uncharacterized protein n=1 Tax=Longispora fulva TaxID=619741 RepID=A0A8J7GCX9_9ACTN|nr:hypothetical protein [Longispora fulva]GIG63162.1 hypothetical protein Lfu02_75340 [Longispora fulva]